MAIVAFIHDQKTKLDTLGGGRRQVDPEDLATGNAKAGERYFDTACAKCHSPTGDLAGIGSKYSPVDLQSRFLMPKSRKPVMATVTTATGEKVSGRALVINNFDVSVQDADGKTHKWPADSVKVEKEDPLEAHRELLPKYTDADVHNIFAYLVTLK
jgi:cytochrome c oxidase cbb3-type subunit 3